MLFNFPGIVTKPLSNDKKPYISDNNGNIDNMPWVSDIETSSPGIDNMPWVSDIEEAPIKEPYIEKDMEVAVQRNIESVENPTLKKIVSGAYSYGKPFRHVISDVTQQVSDIGSRAKNFYNKVKIGKDLGITPTSVWKFGEDVLLNEPGRLISAFIPHPIQEGYAKYGAGPFGRAFEKIVEKKPISERIKPDIIGDAFKYIFDVEKPPKSTEQILEEQKYFSKNPKTERERFLKAIATTGGNIIRDPLMLLLMKGSKGKIKPKEIISKETVLPEESIIELAKKIEPITKNLDDVKFKVSAKEPIPIKLTEKISPKKLELPNEVSPEIPSGLRIKNIDEPSLMSNITNYPKEYILSKKYQFGKKKSGEEIKDMISSEPVIKDLSQFEMLKDSISPSISKLEAAEYPMKEAFTRPKVEIRESSIRPYLGEKPLSILDKLMTTRNKEIETNFPGQIFQEKPEVLTSRAKISSDYNKAIKGIENIVKDPYFGQKRLAEEKGVPFSEHMQRLEQVLKEEKPELYQQFQNLKKSDPEYLYSSFGIPLPGKGKKYISEAWEKFKHTPLGMSISGVFSKHGSMTKEGIEPWREFKRKWEQVAPARREESFRIGSGRDELHQNLLQEAIRDDKLYNDIISGKTTVQYKNESVNINNTPEFRNDIERMREIWKDEVVAPAVKTGVLSKEMVSKNPLYEPTLYLKTEVAREGESGIQQLFRDPNLHNPEINKILEDLLYGSPSREYGIKEGKSKGLNFLKAKNLDIKEKTIKRLGGKLPEYFSRSLRTEEIIKTEALLNLADNLKKTNIIQKRVPVDKNGIPERGWVRLDNKFENKGKLVKTFGDVLRGINYRIEKIKNGPWVIKQTPNGDIVQKFSDKFKAEKAYKNIEQNQNLFMKEGSYREIEDFIKTGGELFGGDSVGDKWMRSYIKRINTPVKKSLTVRNLPVVLGNIPWNKMASFIEVGILSKETRASVKEVMPKKMNNIKVKMAEMGKIFQGFERELGEGQFADIKGMIQKIEGIEKKPGIWEKYDKGTSRSYQSSEYKGKAGVFFQVLQREYGFDISKPGVVGRKGREIKKIKDLTTDDINAIRDAGDRANYALTDYLEQPRYIKFLRSSPIGMPFITFWADIIGKIGKSVLGIDSKGKYNFGRQMRTLAIPGILELIKDINKSLVGMSNEEEKVSRDQIPFQKDLPNIFNMPLPYRTDKTGKKEWFSKNVKKKPAFLSLTRMLPLIGIFQKSGAIQSPSAITPTGTILDTIVAAKTGIDPYSGKEIFRKGEKMAGPKLLMYTGKSVIPQIGQAERIIKAIQKKPVSKSSPPESILQSLMGSQTPLKIMDIDVEKGKSYSWMEYKNRIKKDYLDLINESQTKKLELGFNSKEYKIWNLEKENDIIKNRREILKEQFPRSWNVDKEVVNELKNIEKEEKMIKSKMIKIKGSNI